MGGTRDRATRRDISARGMFDRILDCICLGSCRHLDFVIETDCFAFLDQVFLLHFVYHCNNISLALLRRNSLSCRLDLVDVLGFDGPDPLCVFDTVTFEPLVAFDRDLVGSILRWSTCRVVPCSSLSPSRDKHQHPVRILGSTLLSVAHKNIHGYFRIERHCETRRKGNERKR